MKKRYVFDKDSLSFKKERLTLKKLGGQLVMFALLSLSLTVAFYLVFSFFFNTKEEAALKEQNRAYGSQLPKLQEKSAMLSDELQRLSARDIPSTRVLTDTGRGIKETIFPPPNGIGLWKNRSSRRTRRRCGISQAACGLPDTFQVGLPGLILCRG